VCKISVYGNSAKKQKALEKVPYNVYFALTLCKYIYALKQLNHMCALKTIQIGRDLGFTEIFKICILMFSNPRNSYLCNKLGNMIFFVLGMGFFRGESRDQHAVYGKKMHFLRIAHMICSTGETILFTKKQSL
jgi:hypothetical protein